MTLFNVFFSPFKVVMVSCRDLISSSASALDFCVSDTAACSLLFLLVDLSVEGVGSEHMIMICLQGKGREDGGVKVVVCHLSVQ